MQELIIYILAMAGMVVSSYLFGHLATSIGDDVEENLFLYAFRRLSIGLLLIVIIYAAVNCTGRTILAGVLPLLLFGIKFKLPHWRKIKVSPSAVALFLGVCITITILKYFAGSNLAGNIYSQRFDYAFYAALANYVGNSGIESANIELMFPALQSPTIYHWFDVHLSAMLGQLTGNYYNARLFITLPILTGVAVLGLAALVEKYCVRAGRKMIPWLACLVFFISYDFGPFAFFDSPEKIFVMVCVVVWVLLSENKVLPLVIGGLLISSAAPALFSGVFISLVAGFAKGIRSRDYWKNIAILVLGGLWCVAFYALTVKDNPYFIHYLSIPQQLKHAFSEFSLPMARGYALSFTVKIAINFVICLLLFVLLQREDKKCIISLLRENSALFFAIFTGLIFACLFWFMRDGLQLVTEVCMPLAFVGQTLLPAMLLTSNGGKMVKITTVAILITGVVVIAFRGNTYRGRPLNDEFMHKVAAVEGPVVWVDTSERKESDNELVRDVNYTIPFSSVRRLRNDYFPIRLDVYDISYDPDDMRDYAVLTSIENSTFYRWVESNNIPMKELRSAQTRFIMENNIHYVITPTGDPWINGRGFHIDEKDELASRGYTLYKISYETNSIQ